MFVRILFIYSLFYANLSIGQVEKNPPATNNASVPMESEKEIIQQDSTSIQINFKASKNKTENTESKKSISKKESTASTLQKKSVEFSTLKTQSSIQRTQKTPSADKQSKMDEVVNYLEKNAPESFEYNFYSYLAGNYDVSKIKFLQKAVLLQPNNTDVQIQLAAYYWIIGDQTNAYLYLKKLKDSNRISIETIQYSKDILLSTAENGVLITHGVDDSYGCLFLQLSEKLRTDVQLISLDFLQSEVYKSNLVQKGFILPLNKMVDVAYLKSFCAQNEFKQISISLTTPKEYFQEIQSQLYVVGLTFEYHSIGFNNFYKNEFLWNNVLEKSITSNASTEKAKQLSSNYLLMLLQMRDVYIEKQDKNKVQQIDKEIDRISIQSKKYEQVQKIKKKY